MSERKTALITGASSGIGYELTRLFARDGYDLVLVARRAEALDSSAMELRQRYGIRVTPIAKDLSEVSAANEIEQALESNAIAVDVLVNNAGVGLHGPFTQASLEDTLALLGVNIVTLTRLTHRLLSQMLQRHEGKILNVASTAAFQPGPLMAVYYASKAYVLSFSEALANELRGSGVTVTALCPGPTATHFQRRSGMTNTRLLGLGMMDTKTVALAGYQGLMRGHRIVIPGLANRLLFLAVRWLPRAWVISSVRWFQEKRRHGIPQS